MAAKKTNASRRKFGVVIMHGHSKEFEKVERLVQERGFRPILLMKQFHGRFILEAIQKAVWDDAHTAIIVMSPDDKLTDSVRARQNVIFELGYCMGAFDSLPEDDWYPAVIIVKEKTVEGFADIAGLQYLEYEKKLAKDELKMLGDRLEDNYIAAVAYYGENLDFT
jgi:predicted nucleotide-binding protein